MRWICSAVAIVLIGCGDTAKTGQSAPGQPAVADTSELHDSGQRAMLQGLVDAALATHDVPALGVAIVYPEPDRTLIAVSGVRRAGGDDPVTPYDLWHIGSNTKAVTAAMIAKRVEAGDFKWTDSVFEAAPELAATADRGWAYVAIADFLAHTSGIGQVDQNFFLTARAPDVDPAVKRRDIVAARFAEPPAMDRSFSYSNLGYMAAGAILEDGASSWEEQARAFLREVGLSENEFGFGPPPDGQPEGHRGTLPLGHGRLADNPAALGPAGTLHMSLAGHAKFLRLFLTDGGAVLTPDSMSVLTTPWPDAASTYALGWGTLPNGAVLHDGSNTFWYARAIVAPDRAFGVLIVANSASPDAKAAVDALTQSVGQMIRDEARQE